MDTIEFRRTGNFWIDNGIVALHRILMLIQEDWAVSDTRVDSLLTEDSLTVTVISPAGDATCVTVLNRAKDKAVENYLVETKSVGWFYSANQFSVYRKTDFKMALKPFFMGKTPSTEGALCVPHDKKKLVEILTKHKLSFEDKKDIITLKGRKLLNDEKKELAIPNTKPSDTGAKGRFMTEDQFIAFLEFYYQNSPYIVDGNKVKLEGKGFLNTKPRYEIGQQFEQTFTQEGRKRCFFSGELFKICNGVTGMDYPFLTGNSGELNFASNLSEKPQISAKYAFIALFSFYNLHYLLNGDYKNYFVLFDSNLEELNYFYSAIQTDATQLSNATWCNFKNELSGAEYEAESVLAFTLSIYHQTKDELRYNELYTKSIYTFLNDGNIFRDVKQYTSLVMLFKLFSAYNKNDLLDTFTSFVRFFTRRYEKAGKTEYDTIWRNRLSADILAFRSIYQTVEDYLSEVKMPEENGIPHLSKLIQIYHQNISTNMKTEMVERCKQIGNSIGRYCRETEDKGILFSIRNARNRIDFLKILSESQFRTEIPYSEDFFKELPDSPQWEEYKSLVSIFAMNSFLYKKDKISQSQTQAS